jgi:hypothetical protein
MKPASSGIRTCSVDVATSLAVPSRQGLADAMHTPSKGQREQEDVGRGNTDHVQNDEVFQQDDRPPRLR